jgi:hypothetical protein
MDDKLELTEEERICTAYAEKCKGPGWSNRPVWVIVENILTGEIRAKCMQPSQQSEEILALYNISHEVNKALTRAVYKVLLKDKK